ncbi:breast cancer anti-estrogen resistance protein 3 homolog isoform X2 [Halyomorpha halys]|nr:breast cancer anti-estrogen resistance protein 3 isoform X2 [Halyomorpha halys]
MEDRQEGEEARKALEWELSLDSRDLRSHAWYHGSLPRSVAESLLNRTGQFLVRDCSSQPGAYVLTTRSETGASLHFVINKVVIQPDTVYERVQYQFEDEPFDTVPDLITYYVGSGKPVTAASKARIQYPCNRLYPLSWGRWEPSVPPRVPDKKRSLSLAPEPRLALSRIDDRSNSADGVIQDARLQGFVNPKFSTHSLPRGKLNRLSRVTSDPTLSPSQARRCFPAPPPKPARPTILEDHYSTCQSSRYHSGSDSGNGSGDSCQSSADISDSAVTCALTRGGHGGVIVRYSLSTTTLKATDYDSGLEDIPPPNVSLELPTVFNLDAFQTILLPVTENKPLDATALKGVRSLLQDNGSRVIANHLTRADLDLILEPRETGVLGVSSGLELVALPFGHQMRLDLIERTICLKLLVAVTILTCNADSERAETLNKWIQVAIDTKTALGNLFGFNAIMMGLCMPQIQRLSVTWHILRQNFTDSAFNFEAKLRPTLKNMNECNNPQAPNTTIPHLLPYLLLMDRTTEDMIGSVTNTNLEAMCISIWETSADDLGLTTLNNHLMDARKFLKNLGSYRRNAQIVLGEAKIVALLGDVFRTEFQMKFLWGSRGAGVGAGERRNKFEQILSAMSEMCEARSPPPSPAPVSPGQYNPIIGTSV